MVEIKSNCASSPRSKLSVLGALVQEWTRRCEFYISVVCFVSRCAFLMPSVGSSLGFVLFQISGRSRSFTSKAYVLCLLSLSCSPHQPEVTVEKVVWPWRRFVPEMVDREDALPEMSFGMILVCWMMWRLFADDTDRKRNDLQFTQSASRRNSSPEGVW